MNYIAASTPGSAVDSLDDSACCFPPREPDRRVCAALSRSFHRAGSGYAPIPLGFMRQCDMLVPDAGEQRTVRRILDLRGGGMSYGRIAKKLNADGVTGKAGGNRYVINQARSSRNTAVTPAP